LAPNFWSDAEAARHVQKEHGQLQDVVRGWESKWDDFEETELLLEMAMEEKDSGVEHEIAQKIDMMEEDLSAAEMECMFSGEHDTNNSLVTIHAGAGGTEAQDWVDMLIADVSALGGGERI